MEQADKIADFLRRLTPLARSNLLTELERLENCGAEMPGGATILETLRAEFRKNGQPQDRAASPSRYFFEPIEPLLVDGDRDHANSGRIQRGSLAPIWEWISRDLLPTLARDYTAQMKGLILADKQREARNVTAAFQTKVLKSLESTLGSPDGAERARSGLAIYTASRSAYGDLTKIMSVLRAREALTKFNAELPERFSRFEEGQVNRVTDLLDALAKTHADAIPFALTLVARRLKTSWQLIRLATKAAPSKNADDIAATRYGIAVSMVLDRLDDQRLALRVALKNDRVLIAKSLLIEIYNTEYALQVRIDQLADSEWGVRLQALMDAIAALVEAEVSRFPPEVGHVLGSRRLRTHDSFAGRLTYLAWKGRDVVQDGAAVFKKLISHG